MSSNTCLLYFWGYVYVTGQNSIQVKIEQLELGDKGNWEST